MVFDVEHWLALGRLFWVFLGIISKKHPNRWGLVRLDMYVKRDLRTCCVDVEEIRLDPLVVWFQPGLVLWKAYQYSINMYKSWRLLRTRTSSSWVLFKVIFFSYFFLYQVAFHGLEVSILFLLILLFWQIQDMFTAWLEVFTALSLEPRVFTALMTRRCLALVGSPKEVCGGEVL